jgi:lipopolysaccharide export LptBFGC system permease protein LptF
MRAVGLSLWRIAYPYLAVGALAGSILFLLSERWAPRWEARAERILKGGSATPRNADQVATRLGLVNARDGRGWMIEEFWIDTGAMVKPQVHWRQTDGRQRSIYAESAYYTNGVWMFVDAREYLDTGTGGLPQPGLSTNLWSLPMLTETPEQIRSEVWISERLSKVRKTKEADVPLTVLLNYLRLHPQPEPEVARWLFTMLHGRIAMPWTCLVVVLIALPFAGATGRKNLFVGVASSIVICFAFFVMDRVCLALGAGGHLPPWVAAWLPNALFASVGIAMTLRIR